MLPATIAICRKLCSLQALLFTSKAEALLRFKIYVIDYEHSLSAQQKDFRLYYTNTVTKSPSTRRTQAQPPLWHHSKAAVPGLQARHAR